jgi:hypothetical protein
MQSRSTDQKRKQMPGATKAVTVYSKLHKTLHNKIALTSINPGRHSPASITTTIKKEPQDTVDTNKANTNEPHINPSFEQKTT